MESCIETERDKDRRERETGVRHIDRGSRGGRSQGDGTQGQVKGKKEKERLEIVRNKHSTVELVGISTSVSTGSPPLSDARQDLYNNLQLHAFRTGCDPPVAFQL